MHGLEEIKQMNKPLDDRIKDVINHYLSFSFAGAGTYELPPYRVEALTRDIVKELHR